MHSSLIYTEILPFPGSQVLYIFPVSVVYEIDVNIQIKYMLDIYLVHMNFSSSI